MVLHSLVVWFVVQKTGDVFAVKVFSNRHRERHESSQQEREFALLQKLSHENIVKTLAIEEEVRLGDSLWEEVLSWWRSPSPLSLSPGVSGQLNVQRTRC